MNNLYEDEQTIKQSKLRPIYTSYIGKPIKEVQDKYKSELGNDTHLWICNNKKEYNTEEQVEDTLRVLVKDNIIIKVSWG